MSGAANRARIEVYVARSGAGKGLSIRRRLRELQPARLLIWDPRAEYEAEARRVESLAELARVTREPRFAVRYVPEVDRVADAFDVVCRLAFDRGALCLLAEELSDVTRASWAPPSWRRITTQGRHVGLHVLVAAQRPALIDKSTLGNATRVRCGALGYPADRRALADELDCPLSLVQRLQARELEGGGAVCQFLEVDRSRGVLEAIQLEVSAAGRVAERRALVDLGRPDP